MNIFGGVRTKKNSVGIIGGLGPETTSKFYLELIKRMRRYCGFYPSIVIDSLSFPIYLEKQIIQNSKDEKKLLPILIESIKRLNKIKVDFIVIPCNTAHIFIRELRRESSVPIVSIVDETLRYMKKKNLRNIGILATSKTIESKLYETLLKENEINVILPTKEEQNRISKIIVNILKNEATTKDEKTLNKIAKNLKKRGSNSILLACTDLQLILKENELQIQLLDSMKILIEATFKRMYK